MFGALIEAVENCPPPPSIDDLAVLLATCDRLQAHVSSAVARFARERAWEADGATSMASWLAYHARLSRPHAGALVKTATALDKLPALQDAWADGRLSSDQTRAITNVIDDRVAEQFDEVVPRLIDHVAQLSVNDVRYVAHVWNQHATAPLDEPAPAAEHGTLSFAKTIDDIWHGTLTLNGDDGQIVNTAINAAITTDDPDAGDPVRTIGQRRADALTDICRAYLNHLTQSAPRSRVRRRPHLNTTVSFDDLRAGGPGRHVNGAVIDGERVREYACDAEVHRVVTDAHGAVLDYGHATRTVPTVLWNALVVRDEHCRFPGCDRPVEWCEAHHVQHWIDGGRTALTNLVLLCSRHHHRCHESGWTVRLACDATFTVRTASGRLMTSQPRAPALRLDG